MCFKHHKFSWKVISFFSFLPTPPQKKKKTKKNQKKIQIENEEYVMLIFCQQNKKRMELTRICVYSKLEMNDNCIFKHRISNHSSIEILIEVLLGCGRARARLTAWNDDKAYIKRMVALMLWCKSMCWL